MAGNLEARVMQLERELAALRRLIPQSPARQAAVNMRGLGRRLERVRLTEALAVDGTATAFILDPDDGDTTKEITVTDMDGRALPTDAIITVWYRHPPGAETGKWLPLRVPSGANVAKTKGGGIGAISGSTPGSATCDLYELASGTLTDTTEDATIYNLAGAVGATTFIFYVTDDDGNKWAVVENCA